MKGEVFFFSRTLQLVYEWFFFFFLRDVNKDRGIVGQGGNGPPKI